MEMKLLSYILSRLEIYFITRIYRTSVAFYVRACVNARGEPAHERAREWEWFVRVHAVRGVVCMLRLRMAKAGERKRYENAEEGYGKE